MSMSLVALPSPTAELPATNAASAFVDVTRRDAMLLPRLTRS
jgi:hypothetical protein